MSLVEETLASGQPADQQHAILSRCFATDRNRGQVVSQRTMLSELLPGSTRLCEANSKHSKSVRPPRCSSEQVRQLAITCTHGKNDHRKRWGC